MVIENKPLYKPRVATPVDPPKGTAVRVHQVFLNADCRYQIPGLTALCLKNKIRVDLMGTGQMVVFVNTKRDMLKILACNGTPSPVLAQYRASSRIHDLVSVIQYIPQAFRQDGRLDLDEALRLAVTEHFERQGKNIEAMQR
jgi:hypothetical protein